MSDDVDAVATQIVAAAGAQFLRSGYSRVSTEEIARSIGRSKKTLYKHFATKEALLHAVLMQSDHEMQEQIAALQANGGMDRLDRLRAALAAVARRLAAVHRTLLADLLLNAPTLGQLCWRGRRQSLTRLLGPLLAEAVNDGLFRSDVQIEQILSVFFSCVEGLAATGETDEAENLFDPLVSLLVDGLRRR